MNVAGEKRVDWSFVSDTTAMFHLVWTLVYWVRWARNRRLDSEHKVFFLSEPQLSYEDKRESRRVLGRTELVPESQN